VTPNEMRVELSKKRLMVTRPRSRLPFFADGPLSST
jgi:hypothetical protein